ncbi:hypothetical protein [Falsiroseomonas sp.]|uniref:hypothetical protein n=1 Tax=Falsiroseomonas sp. TaxID=2870721 RepID=UPI0034A437A3
MLDDEISILDREWAGAAKVHDMAQCGSAISGPKIRPDRPVWSDLALTQVAALQGPSDPVQRSGGA